MSSAADLRREVIETRDRLEAADGMETRVSNLEHNLREYVESVGRGRSHAAEEHALDAALSAFLDPRGRISKEIASWREEFADESRADAEIADALADEFPYLTDPHVEADGGRKTAFEAFRARSSPGDGPLKRFVSGLEDYVEGRSVDDIHRNELRSDLLTAAGADPSTPADLLAFVELAVEAARTYRSDLRDRLNTTVDEDGTEQPGLIQQFLDEADADATDPASFLSAHPVALLPVRLETRFVGEGTTLLNESPDRDPHLRLRVFPDDIHVDSHEEELTAEEERMGRFFWAKLWICSHPDPGAAMDDLRSGGITNRVERAATADHLQERILPDEFDSNAKLYEEVKERSWRELTNRFGRERAAWVVHRMAPENGADEVLTGWTDRTVYLDGGEDDDGDVYGTDVDWEAVDVKAERNAVGVADFGSEGPFVGDEGTTGGASFGRRVDRPEGTRRIVYDPPFEEGSSDDPNANVPALSFPLVENRAESWTRQPRARLLPDRWVVYGWTERGAGDGDGDGGHDYSVPEWAHERVVGERDLQFETTTDLPDYARDLATSTEFRPDGGEDDRDAGADEPGDGADPAGTGGGRPRADGGPGEPDLVARGPAIRDPLPLGPDPKRDGDHEASPTETTAASAPDGLTWTADFEEAKRAGMGLRVDADDLSVSLGEDEDVTDVTFERLLVVGVKATMSAAGSTTGLRALFEAHHYTGGLEFLPEGTPTNNTDEDSGYARRDDPEDSVAVECGPPLTGFGDDARPALDTTVPTDGDVLARTLGIATPEEDPHEHVFAHVENADRVSAAAQHHANGALWDGTVGYYLRNVVLSNRWSGADSIWDDSPHGGPYSDPSQAGTFFSDPETQLGRSMVWEDDLRRHFTRYVRASGPLPTIRAGDQPYGILPVTDVEGLESDAVVELVRTLREPFERAADGLTSIDDATLGDEGVRRVIRRVLQRTARAESYETDVLGVSSNGERWREDLAEVLHETGLTGLDRGGPSIDPRLGWFETDVHDPPGEPSAAADDLVGHTDDRYLALLSNVDFEELTKMGYDANFEGLSVAAEDLPEELSPENPEWGFTDQELLFYALTRATEDQWETLLDEGRVSWTNTGAYRPQGTPPYEQRYHQLWDLYDQHDDPGTMHTLLRALARFSLLQGYVGDRIRATLVHEAVPSLDRSTVAAQPVPDPGVTGAQDVWSWLGDTVPGTGYSWLSEIETEDATRIHDVTDSLTVLSTLPPSQLRALLTGTLSLASHRFDAWWTSLATRRLVETRSAGTDLRVGGELSEFTRSVTEFEGLEDDVSYNRVMEGVGDETATTYYDEETSTYVGAYGLVENLSADTDDEAGVETEFTQAPTLQHANTAAILRGAHKALGDEEWLAIDFSADRLRKARWVLEGLKNGQRLGALLGYRFERYLKENGTGTEVGLLSHYRTTFPAVAGTLDHGGTTETDDAEFDVTDGYRLFQALADAGSVSAFFSDPDHPRGNGTVEAAVREVEDTVGAMRDLLLSEDVHQLAIGNYERAGWTLDGLAGGSGVPDLDVLQTPRDGADVSHRTMTLFGAPNAASAPSEWTSSRTTVEPSSLPTLPGGVSEPDVVDDAVAAVSGIPGDGGPAPSDSAHPRRAAARNLDAWVGEFLPDPTDVGCTAAFQWTDQRRFSAGTFETPTEGTTVSVTDVPFEPDLVVFTVSTAVAGRRSTSTGEGAVGWSHGAAARTARGLDESGVGVVAAPDGTTATSSANDSAIALVGLGESSTVERVTGTVRRMTERGFDIEFTTVERPTPVVVQYLAVKTGAVGSVDVGHFPTPRGTGQHGEPLDVAADHVMLAAGAPGAPGFSHGHAVLSGGGVQEVATGVGATPGGTAAVGARSDRSIHLPYGPREATSATVTSLGETMELDFSAAPGTSYRDDGGVCTYVALETPDDVARPAVGILQEGHNDCGFEPGAVSLVGVSDVGTGAVPDPGSGSTGGTTTTVSNAVGLSHGVALSPNIQRSLTHSVHSGGEGHAGATVQGTSVTLLETDPTGAETGRTAVAITGTDGSGFEATFEGGSASDGVVAYVAWPSVPETLSHEVETTATVDDLALTPVDLLYHAQQHSDAGESQLEQRLAHELFLTRGDLDAALPVPDEAAIDLRFTEPPEGVEFSMAELLEVLRSLRELAIDGRSVTADDLVHPAEARGTGYTEPASGRPTSTVGDLRNRLLTATKTLQSVRETLENRRAALSPPDDRPRITERMSQLRREVEAFDASVPTGAIRRATNDLNDGSVTDLLNDPAIAAVGKHLPGSRSVDASGVSHVGDLLLWELETLSRILPAGPLRSTDRPERRLAALPERTFEDVAEVDGRAEIDLEVWRGSPRSPFAVLSSSTVTTDDEGHFDATLDLSDVQVGEGLTIIGTLKQDLPDEDESGGNDGDGAGAGDGGDASSDGTEEDGIVRLSTLLDEAEYERYDWGERVDAVRRLDAGPTDARAILDVQRVAEDDEIVATRVVVSDPRATLRAEQVAVVVESGDHSERVGTGFVVERVERLEHGTAVEWLVHSADSVDDRRVIVEDDTVELDVDGTVLGEGSIDVAENPTERIDVSEAMTERVVGEPSGAGATGDDASGSEEILYGVADEYQIRLPDLVIVEPTGPPSPSPGDVVYVSMSRVVRPTADVVVAVDPDGNGSAAVTVKRPTDLQDGASVTVTATRPGVGSVDSVTTTAGDEGTVTATLSLGSPSPRSLFTVRATAGGEPVFELSGCTVSPDDRRSPEEVLSELAVLPRLLWLADETPALDPTADATPGAELRAALGAVDWDRVREEFSGMGSLKRSLESAGDTRTGGLTDRVMDAVRSVTAPDEPEAAALESFDPIVLHTNLDRLVEPLSTLGVAGAFSAAGTPVDRTSIRAWSEPGADIGRVRAAIEHAVEDATVLEGDPAGVEASFAPAFKAHVDDSRHFPEDAAAAFSQYLAQLLEYPAEFVRELNGHVDDPHEFLRHLGALVYEPDRFASEATPSTFETQFGDFAGAIDRLDSLDELLTLSETPPRLSASSGDDVIRVTLDGSSVSAPSSAVAERDVDEVDLVVENTAPDERRVDLSVGGQDPGSLVVAGDEEFRIGAGEQRRMELAVVRPADGVDKPSLTVTDSDAAASDTVDVLVHPSAEITGERSRDPGDELKTLCIQFSTHELDAYVRSITGADGGSSPSTAREDYADGFDRWVGVAADAAAGAHDRVGTALDAGTNGTGSSSNGAGGTTEPIPRGAFDDALRKGMLEPLRRALLRASYAGVHGATPQSAAGGAPRDVEDLVAQAEAVLERIDSRLKAINGALADVDGSTPTDETVSALRAGLEAALDDGFAVLPAFEPHNPRELSSTFGSDLLPENDPLAAESLVGRVARVRDRPRAFREAYSYGEVVTGEPMLDLRVGQLPHRPDDDWVGITESFPDTNRQSIVAQFETGAAENGVGSGPLAGLFVDDWNETVPDTTQTSGVAVNYDDPDGTAGNAVLLATPPTDGWNWSEDAVRKMAEDAADTMKIRMVDPVGARDELGELLPAIWLPDVDDPRPPAPSVDLSLLEHDGWESYRQNLALIQGLRRVGHLGALSELSTAAFTWEATHGDFHGGVHR